MRYGVGNSPLPPHCLPHLALCCEGRRYSALGPGHRCRRDCHQRDSRVRGPAHHYFHLRVQQVSCLLVDVEGLIGTAILKVATCLGRRRRPVEAGEVLPARLGEAGQSWRVCELVSARLFVVNGSKLTT